MRQTGTGEDRQFLTTNQCVQTVDSGNTCLNEFRRIFSCCGVQRCAVDVQTFFRDDVGTIVDGFTHTTEDTTQNVRRYAEVQAFAQETNFTIGQVDTCCAFEQLYQSSIDIYFQYFTSSDFTIGQFNFAQFIVFYAFYAGNNHQRACDFLNGTIFLYHNSSAPFAIRSFTSFLISASISS